MLQFKTHKSSVGNLLSAFKTADRKFSFSPTQRSTFLLLGQALANEQRLINPDNLPFKIDITSDDEICISRISAQGINNLLIYEDGTMAHSFIPSKGNGKSDFLRFFGPVETINYEHLLIDFFAH